jgi:16S rRNA (uracil1498-N3)-methyltransferase
MNLILFSDEDFIGGRSAVLRDRRARYVIEVHRARPGDVLRAGKINGRLGQARIITVDPEQIRLEVDLTEDPPEPLPVTLLLALPRPKVLSRVLRTITVMGVKRIILFDCWRVEKSFWSSPRLDADRIREALVEGLEQARDTILPEVELRRRFRPFVEDELPALVNQKLAVVSHPGEADVPWSPSSEDIVAAVGPEGGFIPNEITMLEQLGFRRLSLGPRILHVEAAVPALLARLGDR